MKTIILPLTSLFLLGRVLITPGAEAFSDEELSACFARHCAGDWGDLCDDDKVTNAEAMVCGDRILSSYDFPEKGKLWIITEGSGDDRVSTVLTPDEY